MRLAREIRYRMWLWFGHIRTNELGHFEHRKKFGRWPWGTDN